jgi:hypothetical protein
MSDSLTVHPEDPDDEWESGPAPRGIRLHALTAGLVGIALLAGGFWAGAVADHHHNGSSSTNSLSALASRFAAARAGGGLGGAGGGPGGAGGATASNGGLTSGIVTEVQGDTLYVTDSNGNLIKVQVGSSATVTRTSSTPLSGLQVGDNVVVVGSKGSNGTVSATSVRATPAGSGSGAGGAGGAGAQQNGGGGFVGGG